MLVSTQDNDGRYRVYRVNRTPGATEGTKDGRPVSLDRALPGLPIGAAYVGLSDVAQGTLVQEAQARWPSALVLAAVFGLWFATRKL